MAAQAVLYADDIASAGDHETYGKLQDVFNSMVQSRGLKPIPRMEEIHNVVGTCDNFVCSCVRVTNSSRVCRRVVATG